MGQVSVIRKQHRRMKTYLRRFSKGDFSKVRDSRGEF